MSGLFGPLVTPPALAKRGYTVIEQMPGGASSQILKVRYDESQRQIAYLGFTLTEDGSHSVTGEFGGDLYPRVAEDGTTIYVDADGNTVYVEENGSGEEEQTESGSVTGTEENTTDANTDPNTDQQHTDLREHTDQNTHLTTPPTTSTSAAGGSTSAAGGSPGGSAAFSPASNMNQSLSNSAGAFSPASNMNRSPSRSIFTPLPSPIGESVADRVQEEQNISRQNSKQSSKSSRHNSKQSNSTSAHRRSRSSSKESGGRESAGSKESRASKESFYSADGSRGSRGGSKGSRDSRGSFPHTPHSREPSPSGLHPGMARSSSGFLRANSGMISILN
jgi:hypothetical protein